MKKAVIWHQNDVHARFERFAGAAFYLKQHADAEKDLILDAGDFSDTMDVTVCGTNGAGPMELLKHCGFDAVVPGNNEFFMGPQALEAMACVFGHIICANIEKLNHEKIAGIRAYELIEKNGVRFLIIGLTPYFNGPAASDFTDMAGIRTYEPFGEISRIQQECAGKYDLCILLSHCGIRTDRQIAERTKVHLIIGGHSHTEMDGAECADGVYIHQCGCFGKFLGKTEIFLDDDMHIQDVRACSIDVSGMPADGETMRIYLEQKEIAEKALSAVLFEIDEELDYDACRECRAANAAADALYDLCRCDMALINNGILEKGIGRQITEKSLIEASPSGLYPTSVYWYGSKIRSALEASRETERIRGSGKGSGFRGTRLGTLAVSRNVRILNGGREILVDGIPLDDCRLYHVMTSDYLQRGTGYEMLGPSETETEYFSGYIRDLLEAALKDPEFVKQTAVRRIYE